MSATTDGTDNKDPKEHLPKFQTKGGPHDLGDPDDLRIRKVEKEVLIPKKMRTRAKAEKCIEEVAAFGECCKQSSLLMVVKCRKENTAMQECMQRWYQDDKFRKECEQEYLRERSEYRRTGIKRDTKRV